MSRTFHTPSLLVGILATTIVLVAMSQSSQTQPDVWPPPKSAVVNFYAGQFSTHPIPAGSEYVVVTVPSDRWLTITSAFAVAGSTPGWSEWGEVYAGQFVPKGPATYQLDANATMVLYEPSGSGGPLGWTFRPGSSVAIRGPNGGASYLGAHGFVGYYSRQ